MQKLLDKTRIISKLLQQTDTVSVDSKMPYTKMTEVLAEVLDANVYIVDEKGLLLGYDIVNDINNDRIKKMLQQQRFPQEYLDGLSQLSKTVTNIKIDSELTVFPVESRDILINALTTVVPIFGAGKRLGTLILGRIDQTFGDEDLILAEYGATVVGMQVLYQQSRVAEEEIRNAAMVQMAINTLSYSELKAVKAIFDELDGDEGRLTASNIADHIGITRSVIVNALRKLESAGIIESRSLGMKGTYIRVINPLFKDELNNGNFI